MLLSYDILRDKINEFFIINEELPIKGKAATLRTWIKKNPDIYDAESIDCRNPLHLITMLPTEIGEFKKLKILDLTKNGLTHLPESICTLTDLTELNLGENQLKELPASIGKLVNLTTLNLSSNKLKDLPESFFHLPKLTTLDLGENQINKESILTIQAKLGLKNSNI